MTIETPLIHLKPARRSYFYDYLLILIVLGAAGSTYYLGYFLNPIGFYTALGFSILMILYIEATRFTTDYYILQNQVVKSFGVLKKNHDSVFMSNIADIHIEQNYLNRILRYGKMSINPKSGATTIHLRGVKQPKTIMEKIEILMNKGR